MDSKEAENKVNKTIENLLQQYTIKPLANLTHYDEALMLMNKHVWGPLYLRNSPADPIAFVKRSNVTSGVYEIYVNPYVSDNTRKCLLLHEFGHVLFTHMEIPILQEEILIQKIIYYWPELKQFFHGAFTYLQSSIRDIALSLLNIAQDMEVNGKLFTSEEWDIFQHNIQADYITALINSKKTDIKEKIEIIKWLTKPEDKRAPIYAGWHPKALNFPLGLDYSQYVELFIQQKELFFEHLISTIKNSCLNLNKDTYPKLTLNEISKLRKQSKDGGNTVEIINEEEAWTGSGGFSPTGSARIQKKGKGPGSSNFSINDTKELEEFILRNCYNKSVLDTRNDTMYYYNRKKYNSNLMISKNETQELYRPGNIYLLVDCSGSIDYKAIEKMIGVIQRIANVLQKHSRIIWWSTELNGNFLLSKVEKPTGSGGTDIAPGIKYIRENYLKNDNDKLIIISDYFDSLKTWYQELSHIKRNDCMGICWKAAGTSRSSYMNPAEYLKSNMAYTEDEKFIPLFLKKLPTVIINV